MTNKIFSSPLPTINDSYGAISSHYAPSRTIGSVTRAHNGIDFNVPSGTSVSSIGGGKVVYSALHVSSNPNNSFGNFIVIEHKVDGKIYYSKYAHLESRNVKVGDSVEVGQVIGRSGGEPGKAESGHSTGEHLHFELREVSKEGANPFGGLRVENPDNLINYNSNTLQPLTLLDSHGNPLLLAGNGDLLQHPEWFEGAVWSDGTPFAGNEYHNTSTDIALQSISNDIYSIHEKLFSTENLSYAAAQLAMGADIDDVSRYVVVNTIATSAVDASLKATLLREEFAGKSLDGLDKSYSDYMAKNPEFSSLKAGVTIFIATAVLTHGDYKAAAENGLRGCYV